MLQLQLSRQAAIITCTTASLTWSYFSHVACLIDSNDLPAEFMWRFVIEGSCIYSSHALWHAKSPQFQTLYGRIHIQSTENNVDERHDRS
jgi:hypothetical protein